MASDGELIGSPEINFDRTAREFWSPPAPRDATFQTTLSIHEEVAAFAPGHADDASSSSRWRKPPLAGVEGRLQRSGVRQGSWPSSDTVHTPESRQSVPAADAHRTNSVVLVAGALGGAVSRTLTAPLDRLKTIMQCDASAGKLLRRQHILSPSLCHMSVVQSGGSIALPAAGLSVSAFPRLKQLVADAGWRSLWLGNGVNVLKVAPENALKFTLFEALRRSEALGPEAPGSEIGKRFVAGAISGAVAQAAVYPFEVCKTVLQTQGAPGGAVHGMSIPRLLRHLATSPAGVRALYRGLAPSLAGIFPFAGIDLAIFTMLRDAWTVNYMTKTGRPRRTAQIVCLGSGRGGPSDTLSRKAPDEERSRPPVYALLACGAVSSTTAAVVTFPLQVTRTRMQADLSGRYANARACVRDIYTNFGWRGFYRGLTPNLAKAVPSVMITYAVFEVSAKAMSDWRRAASSREMQ
mmetsp:Transcript_21588/g.52611  ORF Transcript_21588/g.52611 Transcript_21588/m.52611 type:complete len:465 (+) Transcript_21588:109-1503(+)